MTSGSLSREGLGDCAEVRSDGTPKYTVSSLGPTQTTVLKFLAENN